MRDPIKVLVVDDSPVARMSLTHILNSDPRLEVIGTVGNGRDAVAFVHSKGPDVVTMDVRMPVMDGYEATRRIMREAPVPIVIVSASWDPGAQDATFRALDAGATAFVPKPGSPDNADYELQARKVADTVRLMSEIRVVRRRDSQLIPAVPRVATHTDVRLAGAVAIGASTGGPPALRRILSGLTEGFPIPILIAQHITAGFEDSLVRWLGETSVVPICCATEGRPVEPGHAYVAPGGRHMTVDSSRCIRLSLPAGRHVAAPSVAQLFASVGSVYGSACAGVLLTGMGRDGAAELLKLRESGALTITQDRQSSVVFGMPGEAARLKAARFVASPPRVAALLNSLTLARS